MPRSGRTIHYMVRVSDYPNDIQFHFMCNGKPPSFREGSVFAEETTCSECLELLQVQEVHTS